MTQWCFSCVGLYAVLAVGFLPKMNCSKHAHAHALIKMIAKNFLGRDYLVCGVCKYYFFLLFYFAMKGHPVELRAEFHQFEPFRIVSSVFSCCIARDSRTAFSTAAAVLHSEHSSVTMMRTPLLLTIIIQCISGSKQLDWLPWLSRGASCNPSAMTRISHRMKVPRENLQMHIG